MLECRLRARRAARHVDDRGAHARPAVAVAAIAIAAILAVAPGLHVGVGPLGVKHQIKAAAAAGVMREKALIVEAPEGTMDIVGTGGDGIGTDDAEPHLGLAGCAGGAYPAGGSAASGRRRSPTRRPPACA